MKYFPGLTSADLAHSGDDSFGGRLVDLLLLPSESNVRFGVICELDSWASLFLPASLADVLVVVLPVGVSDVWVLATPEDAPEPDVDGGGVVGAADGDVIGRVESTDVVVVVVVVSVAGAQLTRSMEISMGVPENDIWGPFVSCEALNMEMSMGIPAGGVWVPVACVGASASSILGDDGGGVLARGVFALVISA